MPDFLSLQRMGFGEMGVFLISEIIMSTQTAVSAPSDPISEQNSRGYKRKTFWDDHHRSLKALSEAC